MASLDKTTAISSDGWSLSQSKLRNFSRESNHYGRRHTPDSGIGSSISTQSAHRSTNTAHHRSFSAGSQRTELETKSAFLDSSDQEEDKFNTDLVSDQLSVKTPSSRILQRSKSAQLERLEDISAMDLHRRASTPGEKRHLIHQAESAKLTRKQSIIPPPIPGVMMRGDKGKARKKSLAVSSEVLSQSQTSNEWKKSFNVPYTPRQEIASYRRNAKRKEEHSKCHPRPRHALGGVTTQCDAPLCAARRSEDPCKPWSRRMELPHIGGPVEIHYENCLPSNKWLEMKPKQFSRNHKHGNHFEIRSTQKSVLGSNVQQETYIWENPYHIWMLHRITNKS